MKQRLSVVIFLSVMLLAGLASAKEKSGKPLIDIQERTLDNGLTLLMIEDHTAPLISYQVYYQVGSRHERPGLTGMAHFFEHMMFRGSNKYGPEEHNDIVKAHGGTLNASTWYDRTNYYENISSEYLELVIHLEAERQANLNITEETFHPEQQVITEERRMRVDNDLFGSAQELLTTHLFVASNYHWPVIGWMNDIQNYRLEDLKWFYQTYYAPNNATVVISGDFNPDEAFALVQKYYGKMQPQEQPWEPSTVDTPQRGEKRLKFHRQAQLPFLFAGYNIPHASHPDFAALEVAQKILASGESSRIYRSCVYDSQVARFAGGYLYELYNPGIFLFYIGVNQGRDMDEAEEILFATVDSLAATPPTETELQKAKNKLESEFYSRLQSNAGRANLVGEAVVTYRDGYHGLLSKLDKWNAVTVEDVQRVVRTYLQESNRTMVIVVPDAGFQPVDVSMGGEQ